MWQIESESSQRNFDSEQKTKAAAQTQSESKVVAGRTSRATEDGEQRGDCHEALTMRLPFTYLVLYCRLSFMCGVSTGCNKHIPNGHVRKLK